MLVEARLRAFAAVARNGSFSRAAQELYVSQPAVSKHVAALEAELGKRLLVRDRKGVTLTPAGQLLADYVLRAEALLANARRALATGADAETGALSVAASGIPGTYLLPELLGRFRERYPAVEIELRLETSGRALELARSHAVELAVIGGLVVPAELEAEPLLEDEIVLIGPPSLGGRRLAPRQLEGLTWISPGEGSAMRAGVEAARWQLGLHEVRTLELPSWEAVKLTVAGGAGIAAISRFALDLELDAGTLAVLDVPRWRLTRTISVVRARDIPLTPPTQRFLDLMRDAFAPRAAAPPLNSNLPELPTALIGRERERDEVAGLLRGRATRLVTLTGPGGSGKTRLAVEIGSRLVEHFRDGVYLVELAGLGEAGFVAPAIQRTLGVPEDESLAEALAQRRLLLLLDNFEHVLAAAPELADLLAASRRLRVLVTSRAPLGVPGERTYEVPPLPRADAVALFVERALAADPSFEDDPAVATICESVDRLPLAIELVAARVRTFSPQVLLEKLEGRTAVAVGAARGLPSRQRSLRATVEWSFDLLDAREQSAFAALAVFRGGWTTAAAGEACDVDAGTLSALVEQSLVSRTGDDRFTMLETIREHALERLELSGDAETFRRRHAEHFLAFAEEARGYARGPHEIEWLDRTEVDLDNIRTALGWAIERREGVLGLTLAEALEPYWYRRSQLSEGLRWLEPLLELGATAPPAIRAGALGVAGRLAWERGGDDPRVPRWYEESLALARASGDRTREAWALHGLGTLAWRAGDHDRARDRFEESLALFLELGEHGPAGGRLTYLGELALQTGDTRAARAYFERSIEEYAAAGDESGVVGSIDSVADVALVEGDFEAALRSYGAALARATEQLAVVWILAGIAAAAAATGRAVEAARLWGASQRLHEEIEQPMTPGARERFERHLGSLDEHEVAVGRALATEDAVALGLQLAREPG